MEYEHTQFIYIYEVRRTILIGNLGYEYKTFLMYINYSDNENHSVK